MYETSPDLFKLNLYWFKVIFELKSDGIIPVYGQRLRIILQTGHRLDVVDGSPRTPRFFSTNGKNAVYFFVKSDSVSHIV